MIEKKRTNAIVLENEKVVDGIFRMVIEAPDEAVAAKPGQFMNLYPKSRETLLPRPISVCWVDGGTVTFVYGVVGKGTSEFSSLAKGDSLLVSSPMGSGYDLDVFKGISNPKALLCGGGVGIPPLLELSGRLVQQGVQVTAVLGFKDESYLVKPFLKAGATVFTASDSGQEGFKGTAVDLVRTKELKADAYFACGPRPMLKAFMNYCKEAGSDPQLSMEERMGCGYGACVGCAIKTVSGVKKVCKDGPVFKGSEVLWNEQ